MWRTFKGPRPTYFLESTKNSAVEQFVKENNQINSQLDLDELYFALDAISSLLQTFFHQQNGAIRFLSSVQLLDHIQVKLSPAASPFRIYEQLLTVYGAITRAMDSDMIFRLLQILGFEVFESVLSFSELRCDKTQLLRVAKTAVLNKADGAGGVFFSKIRQFAGEVVGPKLWLEGVDLQLRQTYLNELFTVQDGRANLFQAFGATCVLLDCLGIEAADHIPVSGGWTQFISHAHYIDAGEEMTERGGMKYVNQPRMRLQLLFPSFVQQPAGAPPRVVYLAKCAVLDPQLQAFDWGCKNRPISVLYPDNPFRHKLIEEGERRRDAEARRGAVWADEVEQLLRQSASIYRTLRQLESNSELSVAGSGVPQATLRPQPLDSADHGRYDIYTQDKRSSYMNFLDQRKDNQGVPGKSEEASSSQQEANHVLPSHGDEKLNNPPR